MTLTDYQAQAEEFARWLVHGPVKGRRKFFNKEVVRGNCPRESHDDRDPSFSFHIKMDAWACSCGKGKASELRLELGWTPSGNGSAASSWTPPSRLAPPPSRDPDDVYRYANGNRKLKFRTPGQKSLALWRHENGTWKCLGEPGIYRLEEAVKSAGVIHVSESESDVDALWELGLAAIATPHGASSPWKELPPALAGRRLVVWEHQDEAGRKYAAAMVDVAARGGADGAIARPREPHKDVRDWIQAGAAAAELESAAKAALLNFPLAEAADALLAADLPPPDYVIQPAAIRGNLTLLQGEPKAGKSMITLYMAVCAALGIWPAGRWSVPKPVRVLYMTWEDGRRRVQKRLRQILTGLGGPFKAVTKCPNLFIYSKSKGPFKSPRIRLEEPAGRALLKKIIQGHEAEFVILDTFSHLTGVDENSKKDMQPVMDGLTDIVEETDCSLGFTHHTGKLGKESGRSATYRSRGSSTIPAAPDIIIHLADRGKGNVTPCRLVSREDDPDNFLLEYLPEGKEVLRFKLVDEEKTDEDAKAEKYSIRKKIIENLSTLCMSNPHGVSRGQVAKACNIPTNTATRHLEQMVDECSIQKKLVQTPHGPAWRYATISHAFQKEASDDTLPPTQT